MASKMMSVVAVMIVTAMLQRSGQAASDCLVDVVFCLDNSGSIGGIDYLEDGGPNWKNVLEFSQNLVSRLNVGPLTTHVGLVDFGEFGYQIFPLNKYTSADDVKAAIGSLKYRGSYTNTYAGLAQSHAILTDANLGARPNINKLIILITDGQPNKEVDNLQPEVNKIKGERIRIVTVAVGDQIDDDEMKALATSASDYVHATDFTGLDAIADSTIDENTCTKAPPTTTPIPVETEAPTTTTPAGPTTTASRVTGTPGAYQVQT